MFKNRIRVSGWACLVIGLLLCLVPVSVRADYCEMAREIAERAAVAYSKNQEQGIKLFIKAKNLCDKPLYAYNLGIAYFQYGNAAEAEKYLAEAVAGDDDKAKWLNDLAAVMLFRDHEPDKALKLAEKAARLAGSDAELGPAIADTLAEARLKSGDGLAALKGIKQAENLWPREQRLTAAAAKIEKSYLTAALGLLQQGRRDQGLALLAKGAELSPLCARTYCQALSRAAAGERALNETAAWKNRYPAELGPVWNEVVADQCNALYDRFRRGERAPAMQQAKLLHEKYFGENQFKETYDKLFNAYLADDVTIAVARPQGRQSGAAPGGDVDIDQALAAAFGKRESPAAGAAQSLEIAVDQEKNIPHGRLKRPHGIALIIGNQHYRHGIPAVRYAGRDLAVMEKYLLKTMGFKKDNILKILDADSARLSVLLGTAENPRGKLHNYVKAEKGKAEVFVYYVGHGAPSAKKQGEAYLVPVNAEVNYIEISGYPLSLFYRNLEDLPAKSVMVVLDACFSGDSAGGQLFKGISPTMLKNIDPVREIKANSFVLCGADQNQVCAWYDEKGHSLMSYYFFEALQGKADADNDRRLTVGEIYDFVADQVNRQALRLGNPQNPKAMGSRDLVLAEF